MSIEVAEFFPKHFLIQDMKIEVIRHLKVFYKL